MSSGVRRYGSRAGNGGGLDVYGASRAERLFSAFLIFRIGTDIAVNYDGGIPYVYCLENGIAVRTDVEVGIHDEERIEILGGLEDGSQVIYSWSNELVDGAEVLLKGASEATEESGQEAGEDA